MPVPNPLVDAWSQGRALFGVWATLPGSVSAEFVARQGPDYVCVDLQHGLIDHSTGIPMLQAITAGGAIPITRVRWNEAPAIMAALDAGSMGVVIPMVNDASEARRAVEACRYPPRGFRSYGPVRAREVLGSADIDVLDDVACIVMVETAAGIKNVDEIAAVGGVNGIYVGPSDLALAMGKLPNHQPPDPDFVDTIETIRQACKTNGIAAGIQAPDGATARGYAHQGFDMITIGSDAALLTATVRANLATAKADNVAAVGPRAADHY